MSKFIRMITLNELIFDIKNIAYGGDVSDDVKISDRQIAFWVKEARALLIRQELSSRMKVSDSWIQFLKCVDVEKVDASECCTVNLNCYVLKSKKKIPDTIKRNARNTILSVESLDGGYSYSATTSFRSKYNNYNKYTKAAKRWYLKEGYLYITGDFLVDGVMLSGVFEDPEEVANFKSCSGEACFTWDSDYPVDIAMAGTITDLVLSTKMGIARQMPGDIRNDAQGEQNARAQRQVQKQAG